MTKNLIKNNKWEDPSILHKNRLPSRGFFIPFDNEKAALASDEKDNKRYLDLNGTWKFHWAPRVCESPKNFFESEYDCEEWDDITVPSNWQCQGYGTPRYTNIYYAFPYDPPYVPVENPTGAYRRTFQIPEDWKNQRQILHFDGVDSAFHVWINGKPAGFSKGSRCVSEFDITALTKPGENNIAVRVYRWSDGSYIEAQDMWLLSGIFRNVYILSQPTTSIWDFNINTNLSENYKNAEIEVAIEIENIAQETSTHSLALSLFQNDQTSTVAAEANQEIKVAGGSKECSHQKLHLDSPKLWNAEEPNLYTLLINLIDEQGNTLESISHPVGIREISWQDCQLKVNGRQIMLRGANRHEHDPDTGKTQTLDHMHRDLTLMKQNNFNAIRFSHYPPDPRFLKLCDEYGFYVMDEADLETHGAQQGGDQGALSKDSQWQAAYLDRVQRMYYRDRNHACVIIWSLGNECGMVPGVPNIKACFEWLQNQDPNRPIHYPQDHPEEIKDQFTDFALCGYCNMETVRHKAEMNTGGRPVIATEYGHAMGNGPGGMKEYWEIFNQRGQMHGGFVWEWIEHGLSKFTEDGDKYYMYGGDFGDSLSDTNFCLDGLLLSDGSPTPALAEFKKVMEPISIQEINIAEGLLNIINRHDFITLDKFLLNWEIKCEGKIVIQDSLELPAIAPNSEQSIKLPLEIATLQQSDSDYWLNLTVLTKSASKWAEANHIITREQFKIMTEKPLPQKIDLAGLAPVKWHQEDNDLIVEFNQDKVIFDISSGSISSWKNGDYSLINSGPKLNLWRAPIDNDGTFRRPMAAGEWTKKQLFNLHFKPHSFKVDQVANGAVCIEVSGVSAPEGWNYGFKCNYLYTIYASGEIRIDLNGTPFGVQMPEILPRIGLQLTLPDELEKTTWYGLGPDESYPDSCSAGLVDLYTKKVRELHTPYSRPQENGSRSRVQWLALNNTAGKGLLAFAQPEFSFSAHHYSLAGLTRAAHTIDLEDAGEITLNLDYAMRGLGSASCGPPPEEEYELHPHALNFSLYLCSGNPEDAIKKSKQLPQALIEIQKSGETNFITTTENDKQQSAERKDIFACD